MKILILNGSPRPKGVHTRREFALPIMIKKDFDILEHPLE